MKVDSNDGRMWVLPTAAAVALTGLLFLYIEVRVVQGGEALIGAVAIIAMFDIVVAALLAITRRLWVGGLALVLLVVGAIGDLPHQVGPILNPPDAEHFIVSLLATAAQLVGIVLASLCCFAAARAFRHRGMLEAP